MRSNRIGFFRRIIPILLGVLMLVLTYSLSDGGGSFWLRIIVCAIFIYCIYKAFKQPVLINPYLLFALTPFTLMIYSEKVSVFYLNKLEPITWFLAIINMIAFLLGLNIGFPNKKLRDLFLQNDIQLSEKDKSNLANHSFLLLFISKIPDILATVNIVLPFQTILSILSYGSIACAFKTKNNKLIASILIIILLTNINSFNKTFFALLSVCILICYEKYYLRPQKEWLKLTSTVIVAGMLMVLVAFPLKDYLSIGGNITGIFASDRNATAEYYSSRINWTGSSVLMMPYMYLISAWNNVQYVIQTQDVRTYGAWFFKPILGYLQLDGKFENLYQITSYSSFNTFTFISVHFKDFGFFGSMFPSVFLGWFVGRVYLTYLKRESPLIVATFSLVSCATLEMFFSNHFFSLSYPFSAVIVMYIYEKLVFKKKIKWR